MRRVVLCLLLSGLAIGWMAPASKADTINVVTNRNKYTYNDITHLDVLGVNAPVPNGTAIMSVGGVQTTIDFSGGGPGFNYLECQVAGCTWNGDFSPGQSVLSTHSESGVDEGTLTLDFAHGLEGIGFQIQSYLPGTFEAEVEAFDGSTLLGTLFEDGDSDTSNHDTAIFLGLQDLTGADITSLQVQVLDCQDGACGGFGINQNLLETVPNRTTPEPASLLLLVSGLGALGFFHQKITSQG